MLHDPAPEPRGFRWLVVLVLLLAVVSAFFDRINIAVLFTNAAFRQAIGVGNNPAMLGLLMTGFVFAYGLSALLLSGATDLFGPRKILTIISLILALAMGLMGGAASYAAMLTGRIVLGLAEGPQFGVANVAVKRWFPPGRRSIGIAIWSIGSPLGSAIGFPLVIFLVAQYGWRGSFYALAGLNALIVAPVVWLLLRDHPPGTAPQANGPDRRFLSGIGQFAGNWRFWLLALYDCGAMVYLWGLNSWLPSYLRQARGFDVLHAGFFSSLPFIVMLLGQLLGAALGDRFRCKAWICLAGLFLTGVAILAAAYVPDATDAALCIAISAGLWGMTVPTLFAIGTEIIPADVTATGFGVYAGLANLVGAAAPFAIGAVIGVSGNYAGGLLVIVLSCMVLSLAMLPLLRRH